MLKGIEFKQQMKESEDNRKLERSNFIRKLKRQNEREIRKRKIGGADSMSPSVSSDEAAEDLKVEEEKQRLIEEARKKERAYNSARSSLSPILRKSDKVPE
jgi:murein L,D-transpeptidase YafK